jgi:hypothetical protein
LVFKFEGIVKLDSRSIDMDMKPRKVLY